MDDESELLDRLPSRQIEALRTAIGRRLTDIRRTFVSDVGSFLQNPMMSEERYFSHNSGPTAFSFDDGTTHHFAVWGEQLSLVLMAGPLEADEYSTLHSLAAGEEAVAPGLAATLGQRCEDVRIWTYREAFESEEAKEAAVSYLLESGRELFLCIYLHEDLDSDYLMFREDIDFGRVASGISAATGRPVGT